MNDYSTCVKISQNILSTLEYSWQTHVMWIHGYARDASFLAIGAGLGVGAVYFLASRYSNHVQHVYSEYLEQQGKTEDQCDPQGHARQEDQGTDILGLTSSSLEHDDIISEQLTRNIQFFGMEGQKKITESFVVVVGLGVRDDVSLFFCY